jgi:hypothetical protein
MPPPTGTLYESDDSNALKAELERLIQEGKIVLLIIYSSSGLSATEVVISLSYHSTH